jgi:hypothetical protein
MLNRVETIWKLLKSVDLEVLIKSHFHPHNRNLLNLPVRI